MKRIGFLLAASLVLLVLAAPGCRRAPSPMIPIDQLEQRVEDLALQGPSAMPSLSVAGSIKLQAGEKRGRADFLLLYDPQLGLRLEVVDPLYRPVIVVLYREDQLWLHDPKRGVTEQSSQDELMRRLTGVPMPMPSLLPVLLGCLPQCEVVAQPQRNCPEGRGCFELRTPDGLLVGGADLDAGDGSLASLTLPAPRSYRPAVRAEFTGRDENDLPTRIQITYLKTGEIVLIRYKDIVSGKPLDNNLFDPKRLGKR